MTHNSGMRQKTGYTAKSEWHGFKNSTEYLKEKMREHHHRAMEEVEFADTDFYEDNIYDEPEYRRSGHYYTSMHIKSEKRH